KLPRFAKRSKKLVAPLGPAGWTASYQWLRNGKAIKQATKRAFKVKKADRGKAIRVKVTLKRYGYTTTVLTSQRVEAR
ncbi:MAG: hypothetical protein LBG70_00655, partial [Bifidobacteriaceae bacterium]|nr:hypothetical protein [Bifidobacteriaceae bacterium]